MRARKRMMMRPRVRARAQGTKARGRRPRVCKVAGMRSARVVRRTVGRLTTARSARAGERRRQGTLGSSCPVGWSQARKSRASRLERRSARAWLAIRRASVEWGPV